MNIPPFLLVNCFEHTGDMVTTASGRSIAFPVAKTKNGRYIFCTCAHTITSHIAKGSPLLLCYADGTEVLRSERLQNIVIPHELHYDLSFLEVRIDRRMGVVRFSDQAVTPGLTLSHVRNVSFKEDFPDQKLVVTTQSVEGKMGNFLCSVGGFHAVDANLKRAMRTLPSSQHKGIIMRSWPGVSGSPLWNNTGSVVGMVAGGTGELIEEDQKHTLVYLPAKKIQACINSYLKQYIA